MTHYLVWFALGLGLLSVLLGFFTQMVTRRRIHKLEERYAHFFAEAPVDSLESWLQKTYEDVQLLSRQVGENKKLLADLSNLSKDAITRVGVVRFNAFEQHGPDLSFSVALLNENGSGMVLTSIFGDHESRVYAKSIKNGTSTYPLSVEEKNVLSIALGTDIESSLRKQ